jgi:hypothetical protein
VQVDPVKPTSKAPGTKRLKLKAKLEYHKLLSSFAFKFNLRRYILEACLRFDVTAALIFACRDGVTRTSTGMVIGKARYCPSVCSVYRRTPTLTTAAFLGPVASSGLHSFTSQLNVSAFCGIRGALRVCFGAILRVFRGCRGMLRVSRVYFVSDTAQVHLKSGRV